MKPLLFAALATIASLEARTFTSADGSKTMEAELIAYRPSTDTVVIRMQGRSARSTVKASAFSKEDQAYFKEFLKEASKRDSLKISVKEESDTFKNEGGLYIYKKQKESFTVSVANRGEFDFEDLTAKYDIYLSKFDRAGKKTVEVVSGEASIDTIHSNLDDQFETKAVEVTVDCSTTSSCPKCQNQAASVKRERVLGLHVRIYDAEDELLTEYYSSNSVRAAAEKQGS